MFGVREQPTFFVLLSLGQSIRMGSAMVMNAYHRKILGALRELVDPTPLQFDVARYLGSPSQYLNIKTQKSRRGVKQWARQHKQITTDELLELLSSLNQGCTFQEKMAVSDLLISFPKLRGKIDPKILDSWLENRQGWAEVDGLCQSTFEPYEMLAFWQKWKAVLKNLANSDNINKRRASLVLLTKAVRKSDDRRLSRLAFATIERLKHEREILITKAVSWLLRALITHHRVEVNAYIEKHQETLPALAYREVKTKLETGKKYTKGGDHEARRGGSKFE